ncbi:MAG TPA: hypothetical protein VMZ49_04970 [Patescibacteria group bacterium]|nr:hypothetical protein [Patescibacteria group bacterium]
MRAKKNPPQSVKTNPPKNVRFSRKTDRSFNKTMNFSEAEHWDILQQISMTSEQRQRAAKELKQRVFGKHALDIRASHPGR